MSYTGVVMMIGFGGLLFCLVLICFWVFFHNLRKWMMPPADASSVIPAEEIKAENRRFTRVNLNWPVSMETPQGTLSAETRDVSLGGAFVICPDPLPLSEKFAITLEVPDQDPLTLTAEVVWSNSNVPDDKIVTRGMGIRFLATGDQNLDALKTAMFTYLRNRKQSLLEEAEAEASEGEAPETTEAETVDPQA